MGLEPTTLGTTNRYANQLSYIHRLMAANLVINFNFERIKYLPKFYRLAPLIHLAIRLSLHPCLEKYYPLSVAEV